MFNSKTFKNLTLSCYQKNDLFKYKLNNRVIWIILIINSIFNPIIAEIDQPEVINSGSEITLLDKQTIEAKFSNPRLELQTLLSKIRILNANFSQYLMDKKGIVLQEQTGNIKLKKPNLLNWRVLAPDESQIIIDGKKIWQYDADLEQVIVKNLTNSIKANPLIELLLKDLPTANTDLEVSELLHNCETDRCFIIHQNNASLDQASNWVKILFGFNRKQQLVLIKFVDQLEQTIVFNFSDFRNNVGPQAFKFVVPTGVEVIEDLT